MKKAAAGRPDIGGVTKAERQALIQRLLESLPEETRMLVEHTFEVEDVGLKYRACYLRAVAGHSRMAGLKAKCLQCVGWSRAKVRDCQVLDCPLWPYRPYRRST